MGEEETRKEKKEETTEEFEICLTRELEETEQIELSLFEDEFLDEFEKDNRKR